MNLETIQQGEELLKKATPGKWECSTILEKNVYITSQEDTINGGYKLSAVCDEIRADNGRAICFLINHASELLQSAREVERLKEELQTTTESLHHANALLADYTE